MQLLAPSTLASVAWTLEAEIPNVRPSTEEAAIESAVLQHSRASPAGTYRVPDMIPFPRVFDGNPSSAQAATGSSSIDMTESLSSSAVAYRVQSIEDRLQELHSISEIGSTRGKR